MEDVITVKPKNQRGMKAAKRSKLVFYYVLMLFPLVQFGIFYVAVNLNSIVLAFKDYDYYTGNYSFAGFNNFAAVLHDIVTVDYFKAAFKNSFLLFGINLITIALSLIFSYYIYKKRLFSGLYKVVLFMPSILSSLALVLIYKYFVETGLPVLADKLFGIEMRGLLSEPDKQLPTILFYNVWAGFGVQIIIFSSTMSDISESIVEAAEIDGVTPLKEFFYITIPRAYSIIIVYVITTVAGIFVNQMNLFNFYGRVAEYRLYTVGYYFYATMVNPETTIAQYPYLSSFGLLLTAVVLPLTFGVKKLMEKLGPKDD